MKLLPKDLSMNIFSRLPSKSVGKSKCVCKEWKNIISDPSFKSLHRERSSQRPNVLLLQLMRSPTGYYQLHMSSVDFDGNLNFECAYNVGASVIQCAPSKGELICFLSYRMFCVCNPTTREMFNLAKTYCVAGFGFGYIKERNEYVLFSACSSYCDRRCEVMRWTDGCCLADLSWKVVDAQCPYSFRSYGFLVENSFYWIGYFMETYERIDVIMSFDLGKEEFGRIVPPEGVSLDIEKVQCLVELKGMLCLTDSHHTGKFTMDIWVMDFKNYTWVKEYSIDLSMFYLGNAFLTKFIPLDHREGKILMHGNSRSLEWYDAENKCFKRIHNQISGGWCWSGLYTDGLFSLGRFES